VNDVLESRLARIENAVRDIRGILADREAESIERPAPVAAPVTATLPPAPPAVYEPLPKRMRSAIDVEQFLGGRFLLGAGGLAFFIGVGLFLKYAFDNNWVGPSGRVAMGLIGGLAILAASEFLLRAGQRYYAQAIAGLGAAILYVSLWSAGSYFHLLPMVDTFIAMGVVTAGVMTIAVRRNSELLAFGALAGGFLTPLLNQSASIDMTFIFSYLAILGTGMLWLGRSRWPRLEMSAFAAAQAYYFAEIPYASGAAWTHAQTVALVFATIFLVQFSVMPAIRARRFGSLEVYECAMVAAGAALFYIALHVQLFEAHRHVLTALTAVLAASYLTLSRSGNLRTRSVFAAVALALITVGVGITFDARAMSSVWAVEAGCLMAVGLRRDSKVAAAFGLIAFACAVLAFQNAMIGGALFANMRFATLTAFACSLGLVAWAAVSETAESYRRDIGYFCEACAHGLALTALGFELYTAYHGSQLALSLLMLAYAVVLVTTGFIAKREFVRWEGLVLFLALVAKVFIVDLASLDTVVRIVSFLAVGAVLLVVALAYQRRRTQAAK
jgi:uncharacterized membrane protein